MYKNVCVILIVSSLTYLCRASRRGRLRYNLLRIWYQVKGGGAIAAYSTILSDRPIWIFFSYLIIAHPTNLNVIHASAPIMKPKGRQRRWKERLMIIDGRFHMPVSNTLWQRLYSFFPAWLVSPLTTLWLCLYYHNVHVRRNHAYCTITNWKFL